MISRPQFPDDAWVLREEQLDLGVLAQTESLFALANGHLGLRGTLDEGEPRAQAGTYLNGLYESYPLDYGERGFGFPEDGQTVVPVTDGKLLRLLVEDEPLDVHRGMLEEHRRGLDLRTGILSRELRWRSEAGRAVRVRSRRLVSFVDRSVAAICFEVEALEQPVRVTLQSSLIANEDDGAGEDDPRGGRVLGPILEPLGAFESDSRVVLCHRTKKSELALAAGMDHVIVADGEVTSRIETEPDLGRVTLTVALEPGRPLTVVKLLAYHWSAKQSTGWLRDQVDASLESALAQGFDGLCAAQSAYLDDWWRDADIEVDGDVGLQQGLRFALFGVLQAAARAETRAIPAKGLTGRGYDGHAFWDTESFVLPVLTYTRPALVRSALRWRHAILPIARDRARDLGLPGAALPWRTIHGEECSGYWPAGTAAFHVSADVAAAVERYVAVTRDAEFERDFGLELLAETARLWTGLGHFGGDARFRIDGVTGPDEYSALVDNNVFTNLMAQQNLRAAVAAAGRHPERRGDLGISDDELSSWSAAAESMYVPYDEERRLHPQDQDFLEHERWTFSGDPNGYPLLLHHPYLELYRKQVVKQPDLVLALFMRGDAFTAEHKQRNFAYYEEITVRDSSLSACINSIVAAETGHLDLAYDYLAEAALMDLEDVNDNARDGVHIASLGGAAMAVVFGLCGMRDFDGRATWAPRLPAPLTRIAFTAHLAGGRLGVELLPTETRYTLMEGRVLDIAHWGEPIQLRPNAPERRDNPPAPDLPPLRQPPGRAPRRRRP